ncbi:MAG: DNA-3-methyladenine glycosylase 2 family protein [Acidimicrobiia bacterium]
MPIVGPLDLRGTLRPLHGRFSDDGWWLSARTPIGPGSLRVRRTRDEVIGEAWGDGAPWLLERLSAVSGLDDDPSEFKPSHPLVAELHRRNLGLRFGRTDRVFDSLVIAICGQKVTGKEASLAIRGLYQRFSDPAPGPNVDLRLPPHPERMADAPYWIYHELHLEKRRADLLRRIAVSADAIDGLSGLAPSPAAERLGRIPGIGEWSVAETLAVSHGDPDQVSVGDYHEKHIVVHHLTGRDRGSDEEMLELLEPFRPHRGRVARLLHTLGHEPKFGPRSASRDITAI